MIQSRINRIIQAMNQKGVPQIVITDPYAIFYLLETWMSPGERFLALYLHIDGTCKLIVNELFPTSDDLGPELVWYNDTGDGVQVLSEHIKADDVIGMDKTCVAGFLLRLQDLLPKKTYLNGSIIVDGVRRLKDEKEQELMRRSSAINDQVMLDVIPWVTKGLTEKELGAKVREIYTAHGIEKLSFHPITAYGKNAADPHHDADDTKGNPGDCVVLDMGGYYENYASDMTRTVFIQTISERHRQIYETVREANKRGIAAAKPGARMCDVDAACRNYIEEQGFGKYFTHRTGHGIGLETHEPGDVSSVNEQIIEAGQCFSVEPGIYIAEEGIGVRIEDLVLITEDGCEVLNKVSKDLTIVTD